LALGLTSHGNIREQRESREQRAESRERKRKEEPTNLNLKNNRQVEVSCGLMKVRLNVWCSMLLRELRRLLSALSSLLSALLSTLES